MMAVLHMVPQTMPTIYISESKKLEDALDKMKDLPYLGLNA